MISILPRNFEKVSMLNEAPIRKTLMEIHILQAGEQLGPFSETQVRQYLGQGLVSPSDLATYEGMPDWQPLDLVLAHLPSSAPASETISADAPPPEPPAPAAEASEPPSPMPTDTSKTVELESAPPPTEPVPSLTASQRTKRKLSKIVIQPMLPLEATFPAAKKKKRTGKTALTLEPLRPTTALPPVTGFVPREKKPTKTLLRPEQLSSLLDFSEKPSAASTATPAAAPPEPSISPQPPPLPAPAPAPVTLVAPKPPRNSTATPAATAWSRRIPREIIYAGAGLAFLIVCVIFSFVYLISAQRETTSASDLGLSENAPSPSNQGEAPSSEAVPKTAADYLDLGRARQSKGDLDGAILDYNQALDLDPKDVGARYRRGLVRQAKGDLTGAIADFTQVIGLDPNMAEAYSNRAFIKQGQGDTDGAIADYNQALLINPKIAAAYYNEGLIEVQQGYLDGALIDYDHAIDLDPQMALAFYNRGNVKNTEGNLDGAIADYTQALVLNPKIAPAYCKRGFARQSKGDTDGALADYSHAIDLDPKMAVAFYNRGLIKVQKDDLEGAIADSTRAIDLDPKNGPAYCNRGLARVGRGDLDGAMADLKTFCGLAPRDSGADTARVYLWLISAEKNPQGDAAQVLATSLQNDWNSPPEDLISKIAAFLLGHINEGDLIANAASPDPSREPGQYCKVWYFAGMKRLLAGDMTTAITYFQKCLATGQKDYCEYIFAQAELKALGQNREVAAKPEAGP
jgi:tetratricopeptide (TPR) repeat protein